MLELLDTSHDVGEEARESFVQGGGHRAWLTNWRDSQQTNQWMIRHARNNDWLVQLFPKENQTSHSVCMSGHIRSTLTKTAPISVNVSPHVAETGPDLGESTDRPARICAKVPRA